MLPTAMCSGWSVNKTCAQSKIFLKLVQSVENLPPSPRKSAPSFDSFWAQAGEPKLKNRASITRRRMGPPLFARAFARFHVQDGGDLSCVLADLPLRLQRAEVRSKQLAYPV